MKERKMIYCADQFIRIIFLILMAAIFIATFFIDKKIDNPYPNTVWFANWVYYVVAFEVGCFVYVLLFKVSLEDKKYYFIFSLVVVSVAMWQWYVAKWMPDIGGYDFHEVRRAAISLAEGGTFTGIPYFEESMNNANIAILLSLFYRIIPNWTWITFLGALCTNFSAAFVALAVKNHTKDNKISLLCLLTGELLIGITWRAFLVYTDNFGMLFVAMTIWLMSVDMDYKIKTCLVVLVISIAVYIKVTNFLLFIACGIYLVIHYVGDNKKEYLKRFSYTVICFGIALCAVLFIQNSLRNHYSLVPDENVKDWKYMFMVGQNTDFYGVVNGGDMQLRGSFREEYSSGKEVKNACLQEAVNRIKARGLVGNISFYLCKLDVAYCDGYFHNVHSDPYYGDDNLFARIYMPGWKYYWIYATILQIIWNGIILCLLLGSLMCKNENKISYLYYLMIVGVTLYLMCFEGRSKYLFMFLPVYLAAAGISLDNIKKRMRL